MDDLSYIDLSAGFNYCISELGNSFEPHEDPCWSKCFFFPYSDIAINICEKFRREVKDGKLVFETPRDFADFTEFEIPTKTVIKKMTLDLRDQKRRQEDLKGVPQTTFNKKIGLYNIQQRLVSSVSRGTATQSSISNNPEMQLIFHIF